MPDEQAIPKLVYFTYTLTVTGEATLLHEGMRSAQKNPSRLKQDGSAADFILPRASNTAGGGNNASLKHPLPSLGDFPLTHVFKMDGLPQKVIVCVVVRQCNRVATIQINTDRAVKRLIVKRP